MSKAKYYALMVDATPDVSHLEKWEAIAVMILNTLIEHQIDLNDCRGQRFDGGSNMSGIRKRVRAFFNIFSSSPQRWEILKSNTGMSIHLMSRTRWSARTECVKPIALETPEVIISIEFMLINFANLSAETRAELEGIKNYLKSFEATIVSIIWLKILTKLNNVNLILKNCEITVSTELLNFKSLLKDLEKIGDSWDLILNEVKTAAENCGLVSTFKESHNRKHNIKK
ncbi:uncharacterized protein LOC136088230 [Hydra vulgaris]|uniref:Uncharacterized protein LOC136088230 n=1 Tax=Hydra vulgaris TaxID=6087 RepID=A0ABM4D163_HYDVU